MLVGVAGVTLAPGSGPGGCSPWDFGCSALAGVDFALNVALFLPVGAVLARRWGRLAFVVPLGLSIAIELLQAAPFVARDPSLRDVVANGLGGGLGVLLVRHGALLFRPPPGSALGVLTGWAALMLIGIGAAGLGLGPSIPDSIWWGQWAPELGQYDRFDGTVREAKVAGLPFPRGPSADQARVHARVAEQGYVLLVRARVGASRSADIAPVASIFDDRQRQVALVGQLGDDGILMTRSRAEDLGFQGLAVRAPGVFRGATGDTIRIDATARGGRVTMAWRAGGRAGRYRTSIGPLDVWQLLWLHPIAPSPLARGLVDLSLAAGLGALLGSLAGRAPRRAVAIPVSLAPLALALWPVPLGLAAAGPLIWAGGIAGWGVAERKQRKQRK